MYSSHAAIGFASLFGSAFYQLIPNTDKITLLKISNGVSHYFHEFPCVYDKPLKKTYLFNLIKNITSSFHPVMLSYLRLKGLEQGLVKEWQFTHSLELFSPII